MISVCEPCCRTRKRQVISCTLLCCPLLLLAVAIVVIVVLLTKIADTDFKVRGFKIWPSCGSEWKYEFKYALDNPSDFGVTVTSCIVELRMHSTGKPFATTDATGGSTVEIVSGISEHVHVGVLSVQDTSVFAQALTSAVLGRNQALLDVGVAAAVKVETNAIFGIPVSHETKVTRTPQELQMGDGDSQCFVDPELLAANITMHRGTHSEFGFEVRGEARTGPCQPKWNFFEVHLPESTFTVMTGNIGEAALVRLPAQSFNLQQQKLKFRCHLDVHDGHVNAARAMLQAIAGVSSAVRMRLEAVAGSSECVWQRMLSALPYLAETEVKEVTDNDASSPDYDNVISLRRVSGDLGVDGNGATLHLSASLSELFPEADLLVGGRMPVMSLAIDVERMTPGCVNKNAEMLRVRFENEPLVGQTTLEVPIGVTRGSAWNEAAAVAISAATMANSKLTFHARIQEDSVVGKIMSWWNQSWTTSIFPEGSSSSQVPKAGGDISIVSSPEDVRVRWLLRDLVDSSSSWSGAKIQGHADVAAGDTTVARASIVTQELLSGLEASLQAGGTMGTRSAMIEAMRSVLHPLFNGQRPNTPMSTVGNAHLQVNIPESLDASLSPAMSVWPAAVIPGSRSQTLAKLTLSGTVKVDKDLTVLVPSCTALVDEDFNAFIEVVITAKGTLRGAEIDLKLGLKGVEACTALGLADCTTGFFHLKSFELGLESCTEAACAVPRESYSSGGKDCPASGCLNSNTAYSTFATAWRACGQVSGCGFVMKLPDGTYYLRRISDPDGGDAKAVGTPYDCQAPANAEALGWSAKDMRVSLLGGSGPGAPFDVPCLFPVVCHSGWSRVVPVTASVDASIEGEVARMKLQDLKVDISTNATLKISTSSDSIGHVAASASLWRGGPCSMQMGKVSCMFSALINESTATQVVEEASWHVSSAAGPSGDFLGAVLEDFTIHENAAAPQSSSGRDSSATGSVEKQLDKIDDMQLISTSAQHLTFSLAYTTKDLLGVDLAVLLGDVRLMGAYNGSKVVSLNVNAAEIPGLGDVMFDTTISLLAADSVAKANLEGLIQVLASDMQRVGIPEVQISGTLTSSRVPAGSLAITMRMMVPELLSGQQGENFLIPSSSWSLWPPSASPQIFGDNCPCINLNIQLHIELYNPLWFDCALSHFEATLHLKDPDGVDFPWPISDYPPEELYFVDSPSSSSTYNLVGRQNNKIKFPLTLSTRETMWRINDEDNKERLEFRLSDGLVVLSVKHLGSPQAFTLNVRYHLDSVSG